MSYELHMTCLLCGSGREGEGGLAGDERASGGDGRAGGGGRWVERVPSSCGGREGEGGQAGGGGRWIESEVEVCSVGGGREVGRGWPGR